MNFILALDQTVFLLVNRMPHYWLVDLLAYFLTGIGRAGVVWFVLGSLLFFLEKSRRNYQVFLPLILAIAISFMVTGSMLKPFVARERPSVAIGAIILEETNDGYSFPSGHTSVAYAAAVVLAMFHPRKRNLFFALAAAIAWSRIYLGKHYPLDVLGGAVVGWVSAWIAIGFWRYNTGHAQIKRQTVTLDSGRRRSRSRRP